MNLERELQKLVEHKKVERCELCRSRLQYVGGGRYRCTFCRTEVMDDFGKIKQYLEDNGPTPQAIISKSTGIGMDKIESYLKQGMVEISNGGSCYLKCEKCGCEIRYGKYCPECAKDDIKSGVKTSYQDIGERPKRDLNSEMSGRMRFINRRGN